MRWLVTGARGQLGSDLLRLLTDPADQVHGLASADLDITDGPAVEAAVAGFKPDVILNAAAYTAVDAAETDEDRAHAVNGAGPGLLAASAVRHGARLIHVSTDYVFSGACSTPYEPGDETDPKSAYGRTKLAGELAVREVAPELGYVVRTSWVYGAGGGNFVKTMARLEKTHATVSVVDDQRGSPTYAYDLATGLIELARSDAPAGIYHFTNAGETTWFGLTRELFTGLGADPERVLPTTTDAFPRPAPRPAYSVLSPRSWRDAGLTPARGWQDALHSALAAGLLASD
jgi:dTDP-4-dehydrorhamnose reductase